MFGVTLGSLYVHVQDCVPALLENLRGLCLALELIGSWEPLTIKGKRVPFSYGCC